MKAVQSIQSALRIVWSLANDALRFLRSMFGSRTSPDRREPVPAQTTGVLPGAPSQTAAHDRRRSPLPGLLVPLLCMEIGAGGGQAGHLDRLASPSISPVLEVEVATGQAPRIQQDLRQLIAQWVRANPTWGEQRVADEL